VIPHVLGTYPAGYDIVDIMNSVLPQISLVAVAFLMMLLLAGLVGVEFAGSWASGFFVLIALISIVVIFGGALGWWESNWLYNSFGEETVAIVVMILIFGLIIWFITKEEKTAGTKIGESLKDFFKFFTGK
jgi:asparagine N-glycosylation enzyme membrane subunit Stt3